MTGNGPGGGSHARRAARSRIPRPPRLSLVIAVVGLACGGERHAAADSVTSAAPPATPAPIVDTSAASAITSAPTASRDTCPLEGEWRPCSVEKRLMDAGYRAVRDGVSPTGVFPVEGVRYALGAVPLHVFVFTSAADRAKAVAAIDTIAVAHPGAPNPWGGPPTLIVSNNLAVVLVSDNGRQIERVQNAITAGLPRAAR